MLQQRILSLEQDVMWWEDYCKWFQCEYDRRHASPRAGDWDVRISSSLTQNEAWTFLHIPLWSLGWCLSACPICKRPLELTVWGANFQGRTHESGVPAEDLQLSAWKGPQEAKNVSKGARAYAYCAVLWGRSAGYALGALVLGARLRELGAKSGRGSPDLVLLYTDDVPLNYRKLLSKQWTLQRVAYIDGVPALYHRKGGCFDGVFTKLHAWNLVKYAKVLLLDLDTIPLQSLDDLFDLQTPAAMVRGNSDWPHGTQVDFRYIWKSEDDVDSPWGQIGGINAGVILLRPCLKTFEQMFSEVTAVVHPAHVPGSGPEQDYLSRFFATSGTPWYSIGQEYNYQLHHVPFALDYVVRWRKFLAQSDKDSAETPDMDWLPARLRLLAQDIRNVHFSGDVKIWHVLLETLDEAHRLSLEHAHASWSNTDAFTHHLLRSCCEDYEQWKMGTVSAEDASQDVASLVDEVYSRLEHVTRLAVVTWRSCADGLLAHTPLLLEELLCPKPSATA